jgi:hypothetical protein
MCGSRGIFGEKIVQERIMANDSYGCEGEYLGKNRGGKMANGIDANGKRDLLQIVQVVAQFLILPLLWLIYQMYLDVGLMKVQMARLEGRIESHQVTSDRTERAAEERRALESEVVRLRNELDSHREKSTYDKLKR